MSIAFRAGMARVDGIIILDPVGKPLITSHFSQHPPSYPSIHIDAYNHALKRSLSTPSTSKDAQLPPIIWVNTLSRGGGMAGAALCHIRREGLKFLVPVSQEVNPLFAFSFLERFIATLEDYLGDVTETTLKDNFDIVYMLIEEMLDEGHPAMTEPAMLKEIVLPPTLMRKLLNVAGVSGLQAPASVPLAAPIPWRKTNVRHANNEIYFDVEERLDAIVDRKGNVVSSVVWGRVIANSRLSGNPDLLLSLSKPELLSNPAFHPCIRHGRWERDHLLSFVPPDGRFRLLDYQASSSKSQLPFHLTPSLTIEESGGRFSLTLMSKMSNRPLEDVVIEIFLGEGTHSASATVTGDKRPIGMSGPALEAAKGDMSSGFVGGGTWEFDPHTHVLKWSLASLTSQEKPPTLTGSFTSSDPQPVPSPAFSLAFTIPHYSYSGIKIDQLKVHGENYKPFKGVRMSAIAGKVEVRW